MHEELESALRELEAKLPDLRHLIADSGVVLTTSPAALVLAARLLRAISATDEVASLLRLTLLNGGELVAPMEQPAQPVPPAPTPPEPPAINPAEIVATGSGLTDSDYALQEALGLIPSTATFFEQAVQPSTGNEQVDALLDRLRQNAQELRELGNPSVESDEYLKIMEEAMAVEEEIMAVLDDLRDQIDTALDQEDTDKARALTAQRRQIEQSLASITTDPLPERLPLSHLAWELGIESKLSDSATDSRATLRMAFNLTGLDALDTFDEIRQEYGGPLEAAMYSFLRNESEAKTVTQGALEHGERVWEIAEGEVNFLELFASLAVQQAERLLPRPEGDEERFVPTAKQVFRHLARHRVEQLIEDMERRLEHLRVRIQEPIGEVSETLRKQVALLEKLRAEVMQQFYNSLLRLDDDDGESDAMGARITPPPPMRGPGAARTFEEAVALA